jgi:hypothetical protein
MTASMRRGALAGLALLPAVAVAATAQPASPPPDHAALRAPQLVADAAAVQPGQTLTLEGTGFPRNVHVALLAGPPRAQATRIGGAQTGRRGHFVATIHIRARADAGPLVAMACHDACRVKATARFRIVAP